MKKTRLRRRKKRTSYDILYDKAWGLWSLYIRIKDADNGGYVKCFTCNKTYHYSAMHAGHLRHGVLDFDPMNIHPQCVTCNKWNSGERDLYLRKLQTLHTQEQIDDMYLRANTTLKKDNYPMEWLEWFAPQTSVMVIEEFEKRNLPLPKKINKNPKDTK
jgi:hypothetical protein